jgi:hypothetical protein
MHAVNAFKFYFIVDMICINKRLNICLIVKFCIIKIAVMPSPEQLTATLLCPERVEVLFYCPERVEALFDCPERLL